MSKFRKARQLQKDHYIPTDLVSPQYGAMVNNVLLGTREVEHFSDLLLKDARSSAPARGVRLYWIHTNPYWSGALRKILYINERVQIIGSDMEQVITPEEMASEDPYVAMARQMVYNHHNGPVERRIQAGISQARESGCDGVVWFNHWGCKHTIGGSALAKNVLRKPVSPASFLTVTEWIRPTEEKARLPQEWGPLWKCWRKGKNSRNTNWREIN